MNMPVCLLCLCLSTLRVTFPDCLGLQANCKSPQCKLTRIDRWHIYEENDENWPAKTMKGRGRENEKRRRMFGKEENKRGRDDPNRSGYRKSNEGFDISLIEITLQNKNIQNTEH